MRTGAFPVSPPSNDCANFAVWGIGTECAGYSGKRRIPLQNSGTFYMLAGRIYKIRRRRATHPPDRNLLAIPWLQSEPCVPS